MPRQLTWYPPAGTGLTPIVLTDWSAGYRVFKGVRGLGAVKRNLITEESPWADGTNVEGDFAVPRQPMLPMKVSAVTRDEFLAKMRMLAAAFRTRDTYGELELMQADGRAFRTRCYYLDGLPDEETIDTGGDTTWCRFGLQLLAPDPYWYAAEPITLRWEYSEPVNFFAAPFLPLHLSPGSVLGQATISNPGSEYAYGIWRITAPSTDVTFDNQSTEERLRVTDNIPAGQTLVVVTEPGKQDIALSPSGTDWWPNLMDGSALWTIPPGDTIASITVAGASSTTTVELEFVPRFGAPW